MVLACVIGAIVLIVILAFVVSNKPSKKTYDGKVHDYRKEACGWGHSIFDSIKVSTGTFEITAFGYNVEDGDIMLRTMNSGATGRYGISRVVFESDPSDMFHCTIEFIDYLHEGEKPKIEPTTMHPKAHVVGEEV
jgi:hypothetical protein